ncbi:MAG: hypothetical protein KDC49_14830 [Saprospiraceae bacterium]|nr:hypothetical protein [Saprospiraceae bacterium]
MENSYNRRIQLEGHLDIFFSLDGDESDGNQAENGEVFIHGDPEGLRSFAKFLLGLAELDQEKLDDNYLPVDAREHHHLNPGFDLSQSSSKTIVGRLDAKGSGKFYDRYITREKS